ncbi:NUDIX domain-containing protein [Kribbella antibiotica]|uniref:NUDIX domain-containing protein n=1 Tax=Kribbella antibiotica TaxID=190195 RepID=A0A4R4ZKS8_9ACTN|nr:NUDIX domain-containing protein [Kribbella antibiotica]TDD59333.1 NUDIX domain-containing protein [Kribbella antibiotica]
MRTDFYNDPDAPTPNSLVVAASAVVEESGKVLMVRRLDSGNWALPGGQMELGESLAACVRREVLEETGIAVEVTGIVGIYSDPNHVIQYSDGEVRQQFNVCLTARRTAGEARVGDSESTSVEYFFPAEIEKLSLHPTQQLRLRDYFTGNLSVL